MAEEKYESSELNLRNSLPFLELFRGFQIAIDPRKLLLAAGGIFIMALGWWVLSSVFDKGKPEWKEYEAKVSEDDKEERKKKLEKAWGSYKAALEDWNLRHRAAGPADSDKEYEFTDAATSYKEFEDIRNLSSALAPLDLSKKMFEDPDVQKAIAEKREALGATARFEPTPDELRDEFRKVALYRLNLPEGQHLRKPSGEMRTLPWSENRGPNPALLLAQRSSGPSAGHLIDWLVTTEAPVLLEPLYKFFRPLFYFLHPKAGFVTRCYFLLIILWTLGVWSLFGGAITRMASVEFARREKVGIADAAKFAYKRWLSYFFAPLFPLIFVAILVVVTMIFGIVDLVPILGEVVNGVLWFIILGLGLLMAIVLVGLVGWPMMSATISAEGTDSWEAVSRSYSYIFQAPWRYLWYTVVAVCYGAAVVFFVGFMGSLTVYLGRWAFANASFSTKREPSFLFVYTPTSFGWRDLLLSGGEADGKPLVSDGAINETAYNNYISNDPQYPDHMTWYNQLGAYLVAFWVGLFFLMIVGFGYSYFWCASTIIYFLMRKKVDDAELDEVYLEEEEHDTFFTPPRPAAPAASPPGKTSAPLTMVEAPSLRVGAAQNVPAGATTQVGTAPPAGAPGSPPPPPSSTPAGSVPPAPATAIPPPSGDGNKDGH